MLDGRCKREEEERSDRRESKTRDKGREGEEVLGEYK